MKGDIKILELLNDVLADELTAISQYMVHAAMCEDWGYKELHDTIEHRAIDEMKHAEMLIDRILFLEGTPVVSNLKKMHIAGDVLGQFKADLESEVFAIRAYNEGIKLVTSLSDKGTAIILEGILKEEEHHLDWIQTQLDQIDQMGIQSYLSMQIG